MLKLYRHQNQGVDHLLREHFERFRSVVLPTAAGKTAVVQVAAARALRRRDEPLRGVLVATSMEHIEDAFASAGAFSYRPEGASRSVRVPVSDVFWLRLRENKEIPERLASLLEGSCKQGILTTHAQLVRCHKADVLPDDLTGWALALDEVQHCGEDQTALFAFMDAWYKGGGIVWTLTATPFRGDGRPIAPAHVQPLVFTYADLADAGILPKRITLRLLDLGVSGRPSGVLLDSDVQAVADLVRNAGRPAIIQVPPGDSVSTSERLLKALVSHGYPEEALLNAVGVGNSTRESVLSVLLEERRLAKSQGYKATKLRAAVSCRRLGEGADWVTCGHVVSIGLSTSLSAVIQLLGRAARSKQAIAEYPKEWRDEVLFTVLVPRLAAGDRREILQAQRLMEISCALQCSDVVHDFQRFWLQLVANFRLPPQTRTSRAQLECIGNVSIEEAATARLVGVQAATTLRRIHGGDAPTLGDVWALCKRWEVSDSFRVLTELMQASSLEDPALKVDYESRLVDVLADLEARMTAAPMDAPALKSAYEESMQEHLILLATKYKHLSINVDLRVASGLQGVLTPVRMRAVVQDLTSARDAILNLTDEQIVQAFIDPYRTRYGVMPSARRPAKDLAKLTHSQQQEADYDRHLRRTGFCLPRLVACRDWVTGPPLDVKELRRKIKRMHLSRIRSDLWSTSASIAKSSYDARLDVSDLFGRPEHLLGLELASRRGWRGLPGGQTLAELLG